MRPQVPLRSIIRCKCLYWSVSVSGALCHWSGHTLIIATMRQHSCWAAAVKLVKTHWAAPPGTFLPKYCLALVRPMGSSVMSLLAIGIWGLSRLLLLPSITDIECTCSKGEVRAYFYTSFLLDFYSFFSCFLLTCKSVQADGSWESTYCMLGYSGCLPC